MKTLCNVRNRCSSPKVNKYKYYGGRGIECRITFDEMFELWQRDQAELMEHPSIDRIDGDGHYTFENCRFIEFAENRKLRRPKVAA